MSRDASVTCFLPTTEEENLESIPVFWLLSLEKQVSTESYKIHHIWVVASE